MRVKEGDAKASVALFTRLLSSQEPGDDALTPPSIEDVLAETVPPLLFLTGHNEAMIRRWLSLTLTLSISFVSYSIGYTR